MSRAEREGDKQSELNQRMKEMLKNKRGGKSDVEWLQAVIVHQHIWASQQQLRMS